MQAHDGRVLSWKTGKTQTQPLTVVCQTEHKRWEELREPEYETKTLDGSLMSVGTHTAISKAMAWVLRKGYQQLGLKLDRIGRAPVDEFLRVLNYHRFSRCPINTHQMMHVVMRSDKNRFVVYYDRSGTPHLIRAVQGHHGDFDADAMHTKLSTLPAMIVHGSFYSKLHSIMSSGLGLVPGGGGTRCHTHCSPYTRWDSRLTSGMRKECEVEIYIDPDMVAQKGITMYRSAAGALLTSDVIPASVIYRVSLVNTGVHLFKRPRPGELDQVAEVRCRHCDDVMPAGALFCFGNLCRRALTHQALTQEWEQTERSKRTKLAYEKYGYWETSSSNSGTKKKSYVRLSDADIRKRVKRARGLGFSGHFDRYRQDHEYRYNCQANEIPAQLFFTNGCDADDA